MRAFFLASTTIAAAALASPNVCGLNATLAANVVSVLNLTFPGLEAVAAAVANGDLNGACDAIAAYYIASNTSSWLRIPPVVPGTGRAGGLPDAIVFNDTFYLAGVDETARIPRNADGGLDWLDKGPRNDVEFMNCLNRHDSMTELLSAWASTGNPIYSTYFNSLMIDWVSHLPCPDALSPAGKPCVPDGLTPGVPCSWGPDGAPGAQACQTGTMESPWRSLEMGIRMGGAWPAAFFGFQGAAEFSTSARVLAILAVGEHNSALTVDGGHPGHGTPNWEMTQWQGLVTSCVSFPELNNCSALLAIAVSQLTALLADGVYPDGVETEQASGYDMGTAHDFLGTLLELAQGGQASPSAAFTAHVEAMFNYGAYVADPEGCLPRNGDSDLCGRGYSEGVAQFFNRSDWTYVYTNGASGTPPPQENGPSSIFPWAGQIAMRSGYDAAASWVWFDVGPYGSSGHAHRDKLGVVLHARGSMLLIDSGRFAYQGTDLSAILHREYASTTRAHNTLTIDGTDQQASPAVAVAPVPASSWSFAVDHDSAFGNMSLYAGLNGSAVHTRGVYYARPSAAGRTVEGDGDWVVVVDIVSSDRPRSIQATWHAHPNSTVSADAATGVGIVGGVAALTGQPTTAQACVIPARAAPASPSPWNSTRVVNGQTADPTKGLAWQGWYSQEYDDAWAAPTLVYDANVTAPVSYFAWLLIPTARPAPCDSTISILSTSAQAVVVQVALSGSAPVKITVPVA